jgi:hypothetical protein
MRRMYGDQRHISVLRAEIESNDVEYTSEWKFREDVRRRYTTSTPDPTTAPKEHITSPYFRPASTTAPTPKVTTAFKSQHIKSDYTQYPKPITPNPDNNDSVASKTFESILNTTTLVDKTTAPVSATVHTTSEPTTTFNLSTSSSKLASEKTVNTAAETTQSHDMSTTPCASTEQTEASTVEPPTATTVEFTSEENITATAHTEKVFESQLFQDSNEPQADSSSESTPTGTVKLRGV